MWWITLIWICFNTLFEYYRLFDILKRQAQHAVQTWVFWSTMLITLSTRYVWCKLRRNMFSIMFEGIVQLYLWVSKYYNGFTSNKPYRWILVLFLSLTFFFRNFFRWKWDCVLFFVIKGTNSIATGSTAELSRTTSAQSVVQQTKEMHNTGMTTSNINASYLLVGIGVVFLILIFITHLYQTFRIKKKKSFENIKL